MNSGFFLDYLPGYHTSPPPVTSSAMSLQHVIADLRDSIRFFTNKLNVTSTHTIFAYSGIVKVKTISDCDL